MATTSEVAAFMRSLGVCENIISDEAAYVAEHYQESEGEDPFGVVRGSLPTYMNRCGTQTTGSGPDATSFPYQPPPSVYVPPVRLPGPNTPPVIINGAGPLTLPMATSPLSYAPAAGGGLFTPSGATSGGIGGIPMWAILAGGAVAVYFVMKG